MTDQQIHGSIGMAEHLVVQPQVPGAATTVTWWLLTGRWHPAWSQFVLCVVHLRPMEGAPEPYLQFPGATHELQVLALNPGDPPKVHGPDRLEAEGISAAGYLEPIDVIHQFEATDEEMTQLAYLAADACVNGRLNPSTDDAREMYRERWLTACVKTLAHMRGEARAQ